MTSIEKNAPRRRRNAGFPAVAAAALVLAAGLAGCRRERLLFDADSMAGDGRTPLCFSPGDTISLAVHETAVRSDGRFAVRLDSVLEDSRCPVDVVCVWEGNARLAFTATDPDRAVPRRAEHACGVLPRHGGLGRVHRPDHGIARPGFGTTDSAGRIQSRRDPPLKRPGRSEENRPLPACLPLPPGPVFGTPDPPFGP
jgi:hypothetical protein